MERFSGAKTKKRGLEDGLTLADGVECKEGVAAGDEEEGGGSS